MEATSFAEFDGSIRAGQMAIRNGIDPITWTNDGVPELGSDTVTWSG